MLLDQTGYDILQKEADFQNFYPWHNFFYNFVTKSFFQYLDNFMVLKSDRLFTAQNLVWLPAGGAS